MEEEKSMAGQQENGQGDTNDPSVERGMSGAGGEGNDNTASSKSGDPTPAEAGEEERDKEEEANDRPPDGNDDNLWEQMTAREGRAAARRAGMRAGDWQAERQLQEALRESRRDAATSAEAEESLLDAVSRALSTVDGEGEEEEDDAPGQSRASSAPVADAGSGLNPANPRRGPGFEGRAKGEGASANATAADKEKKVDEEHEEEELEVEEDEDYGDHELVITQDGGVNSVTFEMEPREASAVGAGTAATSPTGRRQADESTTSEAPGRGRSRGSGSKKGRQRATAAVAKNRPGLDGRVSGVAAPPPASASSVTAKSEDHLRKKIRDERAEAHHGAAADTMGEGGVADGGQGGMGGTESEKREGVEGPGQIASPRRRQDIVLTLSDDVLHRIMLFLHPEDIFECLTVNSQWTFPQHEAVFEGLCRRTYLSQAAKKLLNVKRWRSWKRMFKLRPRLRTSGLYSLKTTYFKKPVRDMSTSWVPGTVLEVTYYRYFRFFGDGRVAYGLTHENPREFVRLLQEESPKIFYGTYTISKWEVNVEIPNPWSTVNFSLQLANGERGRFTHLVLLRHSSLPRNDPRAGRCHHRVKSSDDFTFRRVLQF